MNNECTIHENGFEHFAPSLGGLERELHLGIKAFPVESDEWKLNPATGSKAWAEPFLKCCVSVTDGRAPRTLSYGRSRSADWAASGEPTESDYQAVREGCLPLLVEDLRTLLAGGMPQAAESVVFVSAPSEQYVQ